MDLTTEYLGMTLDHPLVISACQPLTKSVEDVRRAEDNGAAAVVLHSLFEEQIQEESKQLDHYMDYGANSFSEATDFFPDMETYNAGPDEYLELIHDSVEATDIPIIASLNGVNRAGWMQYAEYVEGAGADALELNIYYLPTSPDEDPLEVEKRYDEVLEAVRDTVDIPLAVKLSPFFSSIPATCQRLADNGADGLVLFNRFYQPDFDLEKLEIEPDLKLSRSFDMRLPLRWTAIIHGEVDADIAITSGVHDYEDVLKAMMAGGKVVEIASELLQNGLGRLFEIRTRMKSWMEEHEYESVRQMQGSMSRRALNHPGAFERANYQKALHQWRPDPTSRFVPRR